MIAASGHLVPCHDSPLAIITISLQNTPNTRQTHIYECLCVSSILYLAGAAHTEQRRHRAGAHLGLVVAQQSSKDGQRVLGAERL